MATLTTFEGKARAVSDRILVKNMYFGEQKTAGGIVITNDDGSTRGIYPRWAQVYDIGPAVENIPYSVGDWILIEHGRWTRNFGISNKTDGEIELRMVDSESVLAWSDKKPEGFNLGEEYGGSEGPRPEDFGAN